MVCIRADAGPEIGTGHIMRCLSIADRLKEKGEEVRFISANEHAKEFITKRGFDCCVLGTDLREMESEIPALERVESYIDSSIVIVDSYYVTEGYLCKIGIDKRIVYIDDMFATAYPVDVLINYNVYADKDKYDLLYSESPQKPQMLLGPQYTPLRKEFTISGNKNIRENAKKVLVLTGGSDSLHIAAKLMEELQVSSEQFEADCEFVFVCGALSGDLKRLNEIKKISEKKIEVLSNVTNMKDLMEACDVAVSAAGTTLYELCSCGLPTITYVLADNQIEAAKKFSDEGIMIYAGDARTDNVFSAHIWQQVNRLLNNRIDRLSLSERAMALVDGKGAERIAEDILDLR